MNFATSLARLSLLAALLLFGCSNDDSPYGYGPNGIGSLCRTDYDCGTSYCCASPPCGHGMCSFRCGGDLDCPNGSLCEAGTCFMGCWSDGDCYAGQHCKHDRGLCQY